MANYILGNEFMILDGSVSKDGSNNVSFDPSTKILGFGTECTLSVSADTIDTANKQLGFWGSAMPGSISWTLSSSSLYVADALSVVKYGDLYGKMAQRTKMPIVLGQIKQDASTKAKLASGAELSYTDFDIKFYGNAYMTSLELSASNNEACSYSVEFQGDGALNRVENGKIVTA